MADDDWTIHVDRPDRGQYKPPKKLVKRLVKDIKKEMHESRTVSVLPVLVGLYFIAYIAVCIIAGCLFYEDAGEFYSVFFFLVMPVITIPFYLTGGSATFAGIITAVGGAAWTYLWLYGDLEFCAPWMMAVCAMTLIYVLILTARYGHTVVL